MAQFVVEAKMAPRGITKPAEVLIILQAGAEAGLGYTQSLANICVVNNRPCIWGDALPALVRNSGLCEYIEESVTGRGEQMVATCKSKRKGDPKECVRSFGYADAKQAALLGKDTYKNWPQRMFAMRARAWCLRDLYADVLAGLSVAEEMQEALPEKTTAITCGDDAPLNSLDDAAELLGAEDADFTAADNPAAPTPEELAEQSSTGRLFDDTPQYK